MRLGGRTIAVFLVLLTAGAHVVAAQQVDRSRLVMVVPTLTPWEVARLLETGRLTANGPNGGTLRLAPAHRAHVSAEVNALSPTIRVEALYLLHPSQAHETVTPGLYAVLQSISTMAGIEYYSHTRGRMRVLFHESHLVDGPQGRARLPDPAPTLVRDEDLLYAFQRDSAFGANIYEITYRADTESVHLRMTNLTRMYYQGIIPAVGPRGLELHFVVVPIGEALLFYGAVAARPATLLSMEDRMKESLANRIDALYRWFSDRLLTP